MGAVYWSKFGMLFHTIHRLAVSTTIAPDVIVVQMAAWEFQTLQNIAKSHGWAQFISMQNYYNLLYREEEREMIPYCNDTGVGLIPVSPLSLPPPRQQVPGLR